jgi:hypothetical protein
MAIQTPIFWARYTYHINHPAVKTVVEQFETNSPVGVEKGQLLADLFNEIDKKEGKGQWVSELGAKEWNFTNAYVDYRGPNSPNFPTKGTMQNVLILRFEDPAEGPVGLFYIPYND